MGIRIVGCTTSKDSPVPPSVQAQMRTVTCLGHPVQVFELIAKRLESLCKRMDRDCCDSDKKRVTSIGDLDWRNVRGRQCPSNHAYGMAFDFGYDRKGPLFVQDVPKCISDAFKDAGWRWGREYKKAPRDDMHFEFQCTKLGVQGSRPVPKDCPGKGGAGGGYPSCPLNPSFPDDPYWCYA